MPAEPAEPRTRAHHTFAAPLCFPGPDAGTNAESRTHLVLCPDRDLLPIAGWLGVLRAGDRPGFDEDTAMGAAVGAHRGTPLLIEHSRGSYTRPGLRGHRLTPSDAVPAGTDWSTAMRTRTVTADGQRLVIEATDDVAALALRTEVEALPGGALRARHVLTNTGSSAYLVDGLEVTFPLPEGYTEILDFTGRWGSERTPQRQQLTDGLRLRENRRGRTGHDAATALIAGREGYGFTAGEVIAVHVGWSGNSVVRVERAPDAPASIGGGELLQPGELVLGSGDSYATPWVFVAASDQGLDGAAAAFHTWLRSLPAHPAVQPVTFNVWEAVYFDHDIERLTRLADLAARVGVERYVLDDGWFHGRRDDRAGLGDWWVDEEVWPTGLEPLINHVRGLGMQFGLWMEPEMVNPDSELYRSHPDWILSTGQRLPLPYRNQFVLDLSNPAVRGYLLEHIDRILADHDIDFVKWDHNRNLHEAGSPTRGGAPVGHRQAVAHYELLDELRRRRPGVVFESCAAGGARIDLGVLERVQRVWTSDMTDALARQRIQRWTTQLVAPEYLGAHVSAPVSHQTGRTLPLDFRAATALFCAFGVEWDLTAASEEDLLRLRDWTELYKRRRGLLHAGRVVRPESSDPTVQLHGVIAADRRSGLIAHVQIDESPHDRGVVLRLPDLLPRTPYRLHWEGPVDLHQPFGGGDVDPAGPTAGVPVTGAVLGRVGLWLPRRQPYTITLVAFDAVD